MNFIVHFYYIFNYQIQVKRKYQEIKFDLIFNQNMYI